MVRAALIRFAGWSLLALTVLVVGAVVAGREIARDTALEDARLRGAAIAETVAAPLVDAGVRDGRPGALRQLDRMMDSRLQDGLLRHVKLWSADGTVIWADEPQLTGRRFPLEPEVSALFGTRRVTAEVSALAKAENVAERDEGELLEVYAGTLDADGEPLVFEAYLSTQGMIRDEWARTAHLLGLAVGGLLLFQLAVLPLAVSLARRVERGEAERSKMMRHVLLASDLERRRIAQDLHDGVIQDLAGLGYAIPVVAAHLPSGPEAQAARETVDRAGTLLGRDVAALRSLLTDIYPPDLHGAGFVRAVADLADRARERGVDVDVQVSDDLSGSVDSARLTYRVIREGMRNVLRHAQATAATVEVSREGDRLQVCVADNGVGLPGAGAAPAPGHLGLTLLTDTVRDFGGHLRLRPRPGGGAVLEADFPADLLGGRPA